MLSRAVARGTAVARPVAVRPLSSTVRALAMGESDVHRDDQERKQNIEEHKQDSLKKAKEGKQEWKRELSSESEAAVKADRNETKNTEEHIEQLQKETAKKAGST